MSISSSHAGHGGKKTGGRWADSGAVGSGQQEATLAREINDKIIKYTKTKDSTDNSGTNSNAILANTSANIRRSGGGWHISNHLNAFNGSAHGVEVLYGADSDKHMAERVAKAISDATGLTNRGAKDGKWLYIANNSGVNDKVLLIEWCFIDNKSDVDKLQKNMDKAIQAMLKCFDYNVKIEGGATVSKKVIYQETPGLYEALRDDTFYLEKELKRKSAWTIKKGQRFFLEDIVKSGKYTRAKVRLNNDVRYCTLRDDFWKLIYKTKPKKIK